MMLRLDKNWLLLGMGLLFGAVLGLVVLAVWDQATRSGTEQEVAARAALTVGSVAPDFALRTVTGETVRLADQLGYPVLINFWATWCGPCEEEMPLLQQNFTQLAPDLRILAVNYDESPTDVQVFVDRLKLTFPILLDPGGQVVEQYRVRGFPTSYFIDADGVIRAVYIGNLAERQLDMNLKKIGAWK